MADETTLLANLVDPEVLAPMISAQLPKAIKFSGIAPIDTTLTGQPGSTITVPKFKYIGDAVDVAEGAKIDYTKLTTETAQYTIKKLQKECRLLTKLHYQATETQWGKHKNKFVCLSHPK